MVNRPYNIAIETSDVQGWLTLGKEHDLLEAVMVGGPTKTPGQPPRRGGELMPAIEALCQRHNVQPRQLGEVYVSTGPGSFTGLRVAITTARMLARFLDVKVVGVPTIDVIAQQVPLQTSLPSRLAIALNIKRQTAYAATYTRQAHHWQPDAEPAIVPLEQLLSQGASQPMALVAPGLPMDYALPASITRLAEDIARPHSDSVWLLGQRAAHLGQYTDPATLLPIYARPPEAVELWNQRHGEA